MIQSVFTFNLQIYLHYDDLILSSLGVNKFLITEKMTELWLRGEKGKNQ